MTLDRFSAVRIDYDHAPLLRRDLAADPALQFLVWLDEAIAAAVEEANAFVLSTVGLDGAPSSRTVLLKGLDEGDLVFYTNYRSRKGSEIANEPRVSALFLWISLQRQVRIEGRVERTDSANSDLYFESRPPEARLASAASPQSQVVTDEQLTSLREDLLSKYPDGLVQRPDHWGGYRLQPTYYEFWQGQRARFHDRFRYVRVDSEWQIDRLAP